MTGRTGWAGAAVLAAAFVVTTPAIAQDGATKNRKSAAKENEAARKRAAQKRAQAAQKARAAKKAAAEAKRAKKEAAAAEKEAEDAEVEAEVAAEEAVDAEAEAIEKQAEEEAVVVEEALDAEAAEEKAAPPEEKARPRATHRKHHQHRHRHGTAAPSPDGVRPPYRWAPHTLEYVDGAQVPDGYVKVERVRKGLIVGGSITLGVSWLIAASAAASIDDEVRDDTAPLFVPVVGPFIAMGTLEAEGAGRAALFMNGMAQAAGAAMLISGIAATETVLVRNKYSEVKLHPGVGNVRLSGTF